MSGHLTLANSPIMGILCGLVILIVLVQPTIFFFVAWKRSKELGIPPEQMKATVKSSAVFSIIPSLPIIVSYLLLVPALGRFFSWLRLSVVGSAAYETMVADMAAKSMGYESVYGASMTDSAFVSLMMMVTLGILGGNLFNLFFLKSYDKKVRSIKSKNATLVPVITTAMFLGLYGTMASPYLTNFANPLNITTMIFSGLAAIVCGKLAVNHKKFKEFSFSISLIVGMASAVLCNFVING